MAILMNYRKNKLLRLKLLIITIIFFTILKPLCAQKLIFEDPEFSFQALRTIGYSVSEGADISECLQTCYKIENANYESWYNEWIKTADRLKNTALHFQEKGHFKSAKEAFFRASNYYRTAGFFLVSNAEDKRILETWQNSRDCFLNALNYERHSIELVRIPFENTSLPAYLCLVDSSDKKRPLLIIQSGFDGTMEELYFQIGKLALDRGFNCLLFEGPGQGEVIRNQHLHFRSNWETVISPVVDYAIDLPSTDPENMTLIGISFGGYLAPRALAFEQRIKTGIANGGIYDFYQTVMDRNPPGTENIINDTNAAAEYDKAVLQNLGQNPSSDFFFWNGMYTLGTSSPSELLRMLQAYNMKNVANQIQCKMIVVDSKEDKSLPGQAIQLYNALKCDKEFIEFTAEEGAGEHCQMGAIMFSGETILNRLEAIMIQNNSK